MEWLPRVCAQQGQRSAMPEGRGAGAPSTRDSTEETAMICFSRTASIAPGKASDAIAFGHLIAKYIKETYGTTLEVLVPIGGDPNRIAWHARYDSIAEWDAVTSKLLTDKLYVELVSKQNNTFLPGSVHDALWRSL